MTNFLRFFLLSALHDQDLLWPFGTIPPTSTLVAATESECLGVSQTSWDKKVCFWPFMEKTIDWKLSPMKEWYQGAIWWRFHHHQQVEFIFAFVQSLLFFLLIHWFPSCCMPNISQFRESEKNCSSKGKEVHRFSKLRWIVSCKKIMIWNAVAIIMWSRTDFSFNLSFAFGGRSVVYNFQSKMFQFESSPS